MASRVLKSREMLRGKLTFGGESRAIASASAECPSGPKMFVGLSFATALPAFVSGYPPTAPSASVVPTPSSPSSTILPTLPIPSVTPTPSATIGQSDLLTRIGSDAASNVPLVFILVVTLLAVASLILYAARRRSP
jgi:hypothetical protein